MFPKISVSFGTGNLHWNFYTFNFLTYRHSIKLMYLFYLLQWQCWIYNVNYDFYWPDYKRTLHLNKTIVRLVSSYQRNAHFLYSITIYMLHYNPQHVSSSTLLVLRRTGWARYFSKHVKDYNVIYIYIYILL